MTILRKDTPTENFKENNLFHYFFSFLFNVYNLPGFGKKKLFWFNNYLTSECQSDNTRILRSAKHFKPNFVTGQTFRDMWYADHSNLVAFNISLVFSLCIKISQLNSHSALIHSCSTHYSTSFAIAFLRAPILNKILLAFHQHHFILISNDCKLLKTVYYCCIYFHLLRLIIVIHSSWTWNMTNEKTCIKDTGGPLLKF